MQQDLRLLSVVTRMNVGGPAVQISNLMQGLAGTDVYQVLITGSTGADEEDYLASRDLNLRVRRVADMGRSIRPLRDSIALAKISHFMRGFQPHIVHTHTAKAGVLGRAAVSLTRSKAKRVHTFHGHLLHGYFSKSATRAVIATERFLARRSDRLIAVGANVRDDLLQAGIGSFSQYRVVPPGLELDSLPDVKLARHELGIALDAQVVCFIGRLTAIKRIDRLVDVVQRVRLSNPKVVFLVAGDGTEFAGLKLATDSGGLPIRLLGWRSDVERILAASDAMVLTSDNEGTPVSLIQAGLAGVPAVSTNVGSVPDVILDGITGILAEPDSRELAQALNRILGDEQLRIGMAEAGKKHFSQTYSAQALTNAHLDIYHELMDEV